MKCCRGLRCLNISKIKHTIVLAGEGLILAKIRGLLRASAGDNASMCGNGLKVRDIFMICGLCRSGPAESTHGRGIARIFKAITTEACFRGCSRLLLSGSAPKMRRLRRCIWLHPGDGQGNEKRASRPCAPPGSSQSAPSEARARV